MNNNQDTDVVGREDIFGFINRKSSRLRWIDHVEIMSKDKIQKRVMNSNINYWSKAEVVEDD